MRNTESLEILASLYSVPYTEVLLMSLNLFGVHAGCQFKRVRLEVSVEGRSFMLSVENSQLSSFVLKENHIWLDDVPVADILDCKEDNCEIFYTRNNGHVLCFNPFQRSSCKGCGFCYQPGSNDNAFVSSEHIRDAFRGWMEQNGLSTLSHLEQVAVVTGCMKDELRIVEYLVSLRESLASLGFSKELMYFGLITRPENIITLSHLKPFKLCFTIECFTRREMLLAPQKRLSLSSIKELMSISSTHGITTTFSYILGLDPIDVMKDRMVDYLDVVSDFPGISVFQTDEKRAALRCKDADRLEYYLVSRRVIESLFKGTGLIPNSWSNYRSPWRTCYGPDNESILPD